MGVVGAQRLLSGEWPYRDFQTDITPGIYCLGAVWFGLLGTSTLTVRLLFGLLSATTSLLLQACSEQVLKGWWRYLPWLLWTTAGVMEFPILNHHWLGACATMACWACLPGWVSGPPPRQARLAIGLGSALALAVWSMQSEGLSALLAIALVWLVLRPPQLIRVVLAAGLTSLILWAPFLSSIPEIVEENVVGISHHVAYNRFPYSWRALQDFWQHYQGLSQAHGTLFWGALSHIAINTLRYLSLPLLVLAGLWGAYRRRQPPEQALALAWLAALAANSGRMTTLYVSFQSAPWSLMLVLVLSWIPRGHLLALGLLAMEGAGWATRGWVRMQNYQYPIATRIGLYYVQDPGQAALANQVSEWIDQAIPPGTAVLAFPYAAHFYSCYELRCPIRQALIPPGGVDPEVFEQARQRLLERKVEWVLYVHLDVNEVAGNYAQDATQLQKQWDQIRQQLTQGYQLVRGDLSLGLYRRLPSGPQTQTEYTDRAR